MDPIDKEQNNLLEMDDHGQNISLVIYHEKQKYMLCAQHALNNILQSQVFDKFSLNNICEKLTKTKYCYNPHRNILGLGNFDINVIQQALIDVGYSISWFDMRKDISEIDLQDPTKKIFGLIINNFSEKSLFPFVKIKSNHWYSIRTINHEIYDLDSKFNEPQKITNIQFKDRLIQLKQTNSQIFIVKQSLDLGTLENEQNRK